MTIQYINRRQKTYYLYQGTTKTGKPKYYFSTKSTNGKMDGIPSDYETYENPNGQVFIRKIETQLITNLERQTVNSALDKNKTLHHYIVDIKKNLITIYTADNNHELEGFYESEFISEILKQRMIKNLNFQPEMRFCLIDKQNRYFMAERFCYRGSIDDWIVIGQSDSLSKLVEKLVPHLSKESFYDLLY